MKTGNTNVWFPCVHVSSKPQWSPVMKTGNTPRIRRKTGSCPRASMEPGHEDREYKLLSLGQNLIHSASMEPGHEDREYPYRAAGPDQDRPASMEPGHEDREYAAARITNSPLDSASMEPGHEDREYSEPRHSPGAPSRPQWSPVMKTGNTVERLGRAVADLRASMEPGHEDREYLSHPRIVIKLIEPQWSPVMKTGNTCQGRKDNRNDHQASMEPGHEDREYGSLASVPLATSVAHSCEDCHSAPPADGRERRQGRQEPALTRARALSGDPIGTRALARQSGILSWGAACGVRRT